MNKNLQKNTFADLPIHFEGTKTLIHPIGDVIIQRSQGSGQTYSSKPNLSSLSLSRQLNTYELSGNLTNLKFQTVGSEKMTALTTKDLLIKSVTFLHSVYENTEKQILLYRIIDIDTNGDEKLDNDDLTTLYISHIDGSKFQKLIDTENKHLVDWKVVPINNRLYFRSFEDRNLNRAFDNEDKLHYYYLDFDDSDLTVAEYEPVLKSSI